MNPTFAEPPSVAACDDTAAAISLMATFRDVTHSLTGTARWLHNPRQQGGSRWMTVFKKLAGKLRIWKYDAEEFLRWAVSTHAVVIERPNTLIADWLHEKYHEYRKRTMADAVVQDQTIRGKLDLIRSRMVTDVEFLAGWVKFQPDYKQRLLNQYHALSSYFLATDVVFLELLNARVVNQKTVDEVNAVLVELNGNKWFYQQVRSARDTAILDAGK
jgi:hypothetical protein